ncbi:MAG: hypothetical protein MUE32_04490 [Bacteroidales bacterium]|jgi:hypothetical protein|nr:hypothetical protein [Bacteroidales bacterium]
MKKSLIILVALAAFIVPPALGQNDTIPGHLDAVDTLDQDFGLFRDSGILNLALRFDMTEYTRKKSKEDYLPATLTYYISEKDSVNREIRLRSRGEFRNAFCDFPPLSLNFKKAGFQMNDLQKIEKIKVVTHCQYGSEEILFKEYLVYKLFNVITDYSFNVRLAKIAYINTSKKKKTVNSHCFFIEPLNLLAERINAVPVENPKLTQKNIIPMYMDRLAIFNYMIGNTDWSVPNQHNCKVLSARDIGNSNLGIIIPYDFDYSGLVDAPYAVPYEGLGLESVRQRRYLGECRPDEQFLLALEEFTSKKAELYKVIEDFPYLSDKVKKGMTRYLDEFFKTAEKPGSILYDFRRGCYNFD